MTTASDWCEAARRLLLSGSMTERNSLAADYVAGSGTLQFSSALEGIVPNIRLSIALNTFYVRAVTQAGQTATVFGGQEGSTDVNAAAGSLVRVAPRFTDHEILDAINSELASLSSPDNGLYQVKVATLTYANGTIGYDLTGVTDIIDVIDVRVQASGALKDWPRLPQADWRLDRSADATVFPAGLALQVWGAGYAGLPVRVLYRAPFTGLAALSTDVATTGLPATAYDLPAWGAALRLMAPREVKRNQTEAQGDTRRAAEVPAGAVQGSYRGIAAVRAQRINEEKARLLAQHPHRRW